jgi:hypothetical protein
VLNEVHVLGLLSKRAFKPIQKVDEVDLSHKWSRSQKRLHVLIQGSKDGVVTKYEHVYLPSDLFVIPFELQAF